MAGFFDKVSEFAKSAVDQGKVLTQTAVDKGKELSEIAKLNMDITKAKDSIKAAKSDLGEYVYSNGLLKEDEAAAGFINEINEQLAKIESIKAEIDKIKSGAADGTVTTAAPAAEATEAEEAAPAEAEAVQAEAPADTTDEQ